MKQRRRRQRQKKIKPQVLLLIMVVISAGLIVMGRMTDLSSSGPASYVTGYIIVPMQNGINRIGASLSNATVFFSSKAALNEENTRLKERVESLEAQLNRAQLAEHELEELKGLYTSEPSYADYKTLQASVVAKDAGNWFSTFLINKGSNYGIETGMNVVADGGLVGLVTDVGPNYAKVRSIVDDTSNISAMDMKTSEYCIINGSLKSMNEMQQIEFSELRISDKKKTANGDKLVTSNISSRYLKGIPIGYITEINEDAGNLTRSGKLVPIVDFEHLEYVLVILETKDFTGEDD